MGKTFKKSHLTLARWKELFNYRKLRENGRKITSCRAKWVRLAWLLKKKLWVVKVLSDRVSEEVKIMAVNRAATILKSPATPLTFSLVVESTKDLKKPTINSILRNHHETSGSPPLWSFKSWEGQVWNFRSKPTWISRKMLETLSEETLPRKQDLTWTFHSALLKRVSPYRTVQWLKLIISYLLKKLILR